MLILSITGLLKMLLIIIGVFVILKFVGKMMIAKRNMDEHNQHHSSQKAFNQEKERVQREQGKVTINKTSSAPAEDVDFEEVID